MAKILVKKKKATKKKTAVKKRVVRKKPPVAKEGLTQGVATEERRSLYGKNYFNKSNPDPIITKAKEGKGLRLYELMALDAEVGALVKTRKLALLACQREIVENDTAPRIYDFVVDSLAAIKGFNSVLSEILGALQYGYSVVEVIWAVEGASLIPGELKGRDQTWFTFDEDQNLLFHKYGQHTGGEVMPDYKFLIMSHDTTHDNPYGNSILQQAYWPWWFKKHGIKYWLRFLENYGSPLPVGKFSNIEERERLITAFNNMASETGIAIPDSCELEFPNLARSDSSGSYNDMIQWCDEQMAKAILGQTLTSGQGNVGSYSLGKVHNIVRQDILKADGKALENVVNDQLIQWLVDLNFGSQDKYPKWRCITSLPEDLVSLAQRDNLLVKMGVPIGTAYFYNKYGLPEPEEGEELVSAPSASPPQMPPAPQFAEVDDDEKPIDRIHNGAMKEGQNVFKGYQKWLRDSMGKKKRKRSTQRG